MTERIPLDELSYAAVDVVPINRDWSEGYPENWDFAEAPTCECGGWCKLISGGKLALQFPQIHGEHMHESREAWRCVDPDCESFGEEVEASHENGCEGPMMNYSYALPGEDRGAQALASLIHDLPLCVIIEDGERSLALTGGGMDLSWQIAEAYTRLGYFPPAHFDLPDMAGRGSRAYDGSSGAKVSERDAYVIEACRRSLESRVHRAQAAQARLDCI